MSEMFAREIKGWVAMARLGEGVEKAEGKGGAKTGQLIKELG